MAVFLVRQGLGGIRTGTSNSSLRERGKSHAESLGLFLIANVAFREPTTDFTTGKDFNTEEDISAKPLVQLKISKLTHTVNNTTNIDGMVVFTL